jgi:hypothetical protein
MLVLHSCAHVLRLFVLLGLLCPWRGLIASATDKLVIGISVVGNQWSVIGDRVVHCGNRKVTLKRSPQSGPFLGLSA